MTPHQAPPTAPPTAPRARLPRTDDERGVTIITAAFFLLLMLSFIALGVDSAKLTVTRTMLQNAADAAALAGASAIDYRTGELDHDVAAARAQATAVENKAYVKNPEPVTLDPDDIAFPGHNEVQVTVRRTGAQSMVTHFLQVLGVPGISVSATAIAKAETTMTANCGIVPLGVSPPDGNGSFLPGQLYTLKDGGGNSGHYGAVCFPVCDRGECPGGPETGAAKWSCLMESGYCCELAVGTTLQTEPGVAGGPLFKSINGRFLSDTDGREGITYDDYQGNGERLIFIPITSSPSGKGRTSVTLLGFGAFFLQNKPQDHTLSGEFVYGVLPGTSGPGNSTGSVAFSLRLIH
ncbi:MAG: hypothetical protein E6K81_02845 [Candidatus Eisenbacteria bacterium]|uniref:Putative Flp pilus-assembly TadG-like N-terminal domain-containing protein n=1 Tax=Eiseniibacteriota bacterium TaxID=2212470 RepID=A0A538UD19_UNCEI|nr:MAG: hypothetical protein E6K81_02845 [Candidatus Eisenbacteria bacterium]